MKEVVAIILICILCLLFSIKMHKVLLKGSISFFGIMSLAYLGGIYLFFDLIIYVRQLLTEKGIFFEFGHADILLLEVFFVVALLSVINVVVSAFRRRRRNQAKS